MSKEKLIIKLKELNFKSNKNETEFKKELNSNIYKLILKENYFKLKRTVPPLNKFINLFNSDKFQYNTYNNDIRFITFINLFIL